MTDGTATTNSNVTLQDFDTSVNLAALMLAIGIDNKELENELFVSNIDLALEYGALSLEYAESAHSDRISVAKKAFWGRMGSAAGSGASGLANGWGAYKMGKFDVKASPPEFQSNLETANTRVSGLEAKKTSIENSDVNSLTPQGESQQFKDVTKDDYQTWKDDQTQLKQELDDPVAADLTDDEVIIKQQELDVVNENIKQYEDLQGTNTQLTEAQSERNMMIAAEQRRQADQRGMKWRAIGDFCRSGLDFWAAFPQKESEILNADAGLDDAMQNWIGKVADSFKSLASDHLSNSNGVDQYINNAFQTTQSAINRVTQRA